MLCQRARVFKDWKKETKKEKCSMWPIYFHSSKRLCECSTSFHLLSVFGQEVLCICVYTHIYVFLYIHKMSKKPEMKKRGILNGWVSHHWSAMSTRNSILLTVALLSSRSSSVSLVRVLKVEMECGKTEQRQRETYKAGEVWSVLQWWWRRRKRKRRSRR